jgi:hypothetical protein
VWRSLVARFVRDEEAVGSNPATPTRLSESFGIERTPDDDWFDPDLTVDTQLFLDPILLLASGDEWVAAHDLVAQATGADSTSAKGVRQLPCVLYEAF